MRRRAVGQAIACTCVVLGFSVAACQSAAAEDRPPPRVVQPARLEDTDPALRAALGRLAVDQSSAALCLVADAYVAAGVLDIAFDRASDAIAADPRAARAYDLRARLWRRWGMPERGLGDAHRAAYHAPRSPEAQSALGTMLEALCEPGSARLAYTRALILDPSATYARANLERLDARPAWTRAACLDQVAHQTRPSGSGSRK